MAFLRREPKVEPKTEGIKEPSLAQLKQMKVGGRKRLRGRTYNEIISWVKEIMIGDKAPKDTQLKEKFGISLTTLRRYAKEKNEKIQIRKFGETAYFWID